MNSEAEAGPSPARRKEVRPFGPARGEGPGGIFGPLRYDEVARDSGGAGGTGPDLNDFRSGGPPATICDVAVRRGELAVLKGAGAAVIYEMAVRCFLDLGRPAVLVDGGCQADPYEVAAIAKRLGREMAEDGTAGGGTSGAGMSGVGTSGAGTSGVGTSGVGTTGIAAGGGSPGIVGTIGKASRRRRVDEDEVLRNVHVARAFTAHQLEALIVQRLEPMLVRHRPVFVGVLSIDMLFRDEELDRYEAKIMQARCLRALRRLAREHNVMAVATKIGGRTVRHMRWY